MSIDTLMHSLTVARRRALGDTLLLPCVDIVTMTACFWLGGLVNFSYQNWTVERSLILMILSLAAITAFYLQGHYSRRRSFWQETGDVVMVSSLALVADSALLYLLKVNFSRVWVVTSWALILIAVPLVRRLAKHVSLRLGAWKQPTVVIGTGPNAIDAAGVFTTDSHLGYELLAFLDPSGRAAGQSHFRFDGRQVPIEALDPGSYMLPPWLGQPHVIVALELDEIAGREQLIERISLHHGDIDVISPLRGLPANRARVTHFFSHDILSLRIYNNLARPFSQLLKRSFDLIVGSALLLAASPVMLLIVWQIRRSGGPAMFAHERIGRHGRLFKCYKFRTMVTDAPTVLARLLAEDPVARAEWERDYKLKNDPRITPIGRWLRKTSFDELPQLLNVLKGEMSLVGPRPVVKDELRRYGDAQLYYTQVRPGLTGLWQISGRNDVDYGRRINLDTWYVRNWNIWYDVVILAKTCRAVLSRSGAY